MAIKPKSLSPILPIRATPEISKIEEIKPVQPIKPVYGFNSIQAKKDSYYRNQKQIETYLANYNDPTELNSFIDALTNTEAVSKEFGETWGAISTTSGQVSVIAAAASVILEIGAWIASAFLPDAGLIGAAGSTASKGIRTASAAAKMAKAAKVAKTVSKVAAIPSIPASTKVLIDREIKPIVAGKSGEAVINMLMNVGETMDYAANPVKGLILEGPEGFVKGAGFSNEGRVNYDYDTGFFLTDMLLEIITDPTSWSDAFVKGIPGVKGALPRAADDLAETVTKEAVDTVIDATDNIVIKEITGEYSIQGLEKLRSTVKKTTSQVIREWNDASFKKLNSVAKKKLIQQGQEKIRGAFAKGLKKANPKLSNKAINMILNHSQRLAKNTTMTKSIDKLINDFTFDSLSNQVIKSLSGIQYYSDSYQGFLLKSALMSSGYGGAMQLLKKGFSPLAEYAQNLQLSKLEKAGKELFDKNKGFNIARYEDAKKWWASTEQYKNGITRSVTETPMQTFYKAFEAQLNADRSAIQDIIKQNAKNPEKAATSLDELFLQKQGCTFEQYIEYLKNINANENNILDTYIHQLEVQRRQLINNSAKHAAGLPIREAGQIITKQSLKTFDEDALIVQTRNKMFRQFAENTEPLTDTVYGLKITDETTNSMLLNTAEIVDFMDEILDTSTGNVGAYIKNILDDLNSAADTADAEIRASLNYMLTSAQSFKNLQTLYAEIGMILDLPDTIKDTDFYKYLINEITGLTGTVSDLYNSFEATMSQLWSNLERLYADQGIKGLRLAEYSDLNHQVRAALYAYLKAQYELGIQSIKTGVMEDLTEALRIFLNYSGNKIPSKVLLRCAEFDHIIRLIKKIKNFNEENFSILGTQKMFIDNHWDDATLTLYGLARRTIIEQSELALYQFKNNPGYLIYEQASYVAKRVMNMAEQAKQFSHIFTEDVTTQINNAYKMVFTELLPKLDADKVLYATYQNFKEATDVYTQFAQLCEIYKALNPKTDKELYMTLTLILAEHITDKNMYFGILHPNQLLRLEHIDDPVSYNVKFTKKQLREEEINLINQWRNFTNSSDKIVNDLRRTYNENEMTDAQIFYLKRYTEMLEPVNKELKQLADINDQLYDSEIAKQHLENLYETFNMYPELQMRYGEVLGKVDRYWNGELTFSVAEDAEQGALYIRKRRELMAEYYNRNGEYPNEAARQQIETKLLQEFGAQNVDEYTAIYDDFSRMLAEIQDKVRAEALNNTPLKEKLKQAYAEIKAQFKAKLTADETSNAWRASADQAPIVLETTTGGTLTYYPSTDQITWERRRITDKPFTETEEFLEEFDVVGDSKYTPDLTAYLTNVTQGYADQDYAKARYGYRNHYKAAWNLRDILLLNDDAIDDIDKEIIIHCIFQNADDAAYTKITTEHPAVQAAFAAIQDTKNAFPEFFSKIDYDTHQEVLSFIKEQFPEDLKKAREYIAQQQYLKDIRHIAQEYAQNVPAELLNKYNTFLNNAVAEYRYVRKKYPHNKYYQHADNSIGFFKQRRGLIRRYIKDAIEATNRNTTYTKEMKEVFIENYKQLRTIFDAQFKAEFDAIYKPLNEIITQTQKHFRSEMGNTIQKELSKRFEPVMQKIVDEHMANIAKTNKLINATQISLKDPFQKQIEYSKHFKQATANNAKNILAARLEQTADDMVVDLAHSFGHIVFAQNDLDSIKMNPHYFKRLIKSYKEAGIEYVTSADGQYHMFYLKDWKDITMDGRQVCYKTNPVTRMQINKAHGEYQIVDDYIKETLQDTSAHVQKLFDDFDENIFELTGVRTGYSQGEIFNKNSFAEYYERLPIEFQEALGKEAFLDYMTDSQFFQTIRFNESFIGTPTNKINFGIRVSPNGAFNLRNTYTSIANYIKPQIEYVNMVFDQKFSINSGLYKNFTDIDLLEALQLNPDYKLIALVHDAKYGVRTKEILPLSVKSIQQARRLNAVVLPLQVYKDMYKHVNHRLGASGAAKLWNRIMYVYKFGYLFRPGAWIRNFIDTNIKSYLEMGPEYKEYKLKAHRILNEYDSIQEFILARKAKSTTKQFDYNAAILEYFTEHPDSALTYAQYKELQRNYFSQGVADNVMSQFIKELNGTQAGDAWTKFTEITGKALATPNSTERYNRLAVYLYNLDHGADVTSALSRLSTVHFDYSFKTNVEQLLDMVFPFATFSLRNYSYWIEMLEKNPWIMKQYVHLMKPSWDFKDYTPEQLATDHRAQTQMIYGQMKLAEFNDKLLTFKANPSIQDALQMFSDPINNIYDKLAAPISVPLDVATGQYTQPTNLIPVIGPVIQSAQTALKSGSPIPSAIGVSKQYKSKGKSKVNFKNKNLSGVNTFSDTNYKAPKYRNNIVFDSYKTIGTQRYRLNMYPVIDIAHEIKSRYTTNVYNKIKSRVQTDVYKGIRYRLN